MTRTYRNIWLLVRGLIGPVLVWALLLVVVWNALQSRIHGDDEYDKAALLEWVDESRVFRQTLPELVREYLDAADPDKGQTGTLATRAVEIQEQLKALAAPTKMYGAQLPLFPTIYRLELSFASQSALPPVIWESQVPRPAHSASTRQLRHSLLGPSDPRALLLVEYQLHAYNTRQHDEQIAAARFRWLVALAAASTLLAFAWIYLAQRRERQRENRRLLAQQQIDRAERLVLENQLKRQEAEHEREEAERQLLKQGLARQEAESQALELKSQLYAGIGIMAGSYAHNIKNLLVRPSDLLRRCLEGDHLSQDQAFMLREVSQTLGTVTERLQQILQTVRRDPGRTEIARLDLGQLVREVGKSWEDLAREKWKLRLSTDIGAEPLWIDGDASRLQQAIENLLFNARDATFEMRNHLREQARKDSRLDADQLRQALIAAAAWKGTVILRTLATPNEAILEIADTGIGMTDDVRRQCTQTHFSTKRDNALYEGNTTGMGLGLSFVAAIVENHGAKLEIVTAPLAGACFRVRIARTDAQAHSPAPLAPQTQAS